MTVTERFLRYVQIDTQSKPDMDVVPSTRKQHDLAKLLAEELQAMGAQVTYDTDHCYVYASIPATIQTSASPLGLIAHMDTSDAVSGKDVKPRIVSAYPGGDIVLNEAEHIALSPSVFPELSEYIGQDVIVTDGTTLLGADDKAGVAEIMALAERLLADPSIPHGEIRIAFTPDEEVGNGVAAFDNDVFGAPVAYTVDGGKVGEIGYETFNAASLTLTVHGVSTHPGSAKGKMQNALLLGMEFESMLPTFEKPEYTEQREGFYHLTDMQGDVDTAVLHYILRDHDAEKLEEKKQCVRRICGYLNEKYGEGSFEATISDAYRNMREVIEHHFYLVKQAEEAMKECGVEPFESVVRGGTDGSVLSFRGIPCPNLSTGGHNCHGRYEFITVQSLQKMTDILERIVTRHAQSAQK